MRWTGSQAFSVVGTCRIPSDHPLPADVGDFHPNDLVPALRSYSGSTGSPSAEAGSEMAQESAGSGKDRGTRREAFGRYFVEERHLPLRARNLLYATAAVLAIGGVVLFFAVLKDVVEHDGFAGSDQWAQRTVLTIRSDLFTFVMTVLAAVFGPVALPLIVLSVTLVWSLRAKHAWRPVLLAGAMITGVVLAQIISRLVGRQRPPVDLMLLDVDHTFSFPSGHVLGASNFLLVLAFLFFSRRKSVAVTAWGFIGAVILVVLAAFSRVYLGYHWVSDALGSVSLSVTLLGAVIAVDTWRTVHVVPDPRRSQLRPDTG